jgi:hypothetical protein
MVAKKGNYGGIYDLLLDCEKQNKLFNVTEMAPQLGYEVSSVKVYIRNKLKNKFLIDLQNGSYRVQNIANTDRSSFISYMAQKSGEVSASIDVPNPQRSLVDKMTECSVASFHSALAHYNNPSAKLRTEIFTMLLINSWELILKAFLVDRFNLGRIKSTNSTTISISNALKQVYPKADDPCRGNLEKIIELRNQSTHFVIEEFSTAYERLFQSCIINYIDFVTNKLHAHDKLNLNLSSLLIANDEATPVDLNSITAIYGAEIVEDFRLSQTSINAQEHSYNSERYSIPIHYRLTVTTKPNTGTCLLELDSEGKMGYIVQVPIDPESTHPYRETDIIPVIAKEIPGFSRTQFRSIVYSEKIKDTKSSPYHYRFVSSNTNMYSDRLIEFITAKNRAEPQYIDKCVQKYKAHNNLPKNSTA